LEIGIVVYKLNFFVPESHLQSVKLALFNEGAGRVGDYDCCCWQVLGEGQFRPLKGSLPYIGRQGQLEKVAEYKVEMVCEDQFIKQVVMALLDAHPYQQPAYDLYKLEGLSQ